VFCDQHTIAGQGGGLPSAGELLATIAAYRATGDGDRVEVAFYGGTFTALPRDTQEQLLAPLQPFLARGDVECVRVSTRPDAMDADVADYLRHKGVTTVELGVQSLDDEVLRLSGRGHAAHHVERAVAALHAAGVRFVAQLMPGLPGDTAAGALATLDAVLAMAPTALRIYPTVVLAGTRLEALWHEGGYQPLTLAAAVRTCKLMLHRALGAGVPVLRMGLQPTDDLQAPGAVVAGPFHPAFRQLVESELCFDFISRVAAAIPGERTATVACAPSRVADVIGQRRSNLERLHRAHGLRVTAVTPDPVLSREELEVRGAHFRQRGNIVHDLTYGAEALRD
jgi:histone acetyltransferase (RNA polymerase elongator complex component)